MKILNVKYARNGSGTAHGFYTVLCEDKATAREWEPGICGNQFLVTFLGDDKNQIDFDSIRVSNIKNFELSFRPEHFERFLSLALTDYCVKNGSTEISWSEACYPRSKKVQL